MRLAHLGAAGLLLTATAFAAPAFAAPKSAIRIEGAHLRPIPATLPMTAGYLTIHNDGARPDALVSASCACATSVSAHESDDKGGMSTMRATGPVSIPAKGSVTFAPGGRHLMLMGVKGGVKAGQTLRLSLRFAHAGVLMVPFDGRN